MLYQIVSFLLDVVAGLLCGACLLRIYMQWQRVPFGNPVRCGIAQAPNCGDLGSQRFITYTLNGYSHE